MCGSEGFQSPKNYISFKVPHGQLHSGDHCSKPDHEGVQRTHSQKGLEIPRQDHAKKDELGKPPMVSTLA